MNNIEKLNQTFARMLNINISKVNDDLAYDSVPEWDSVAHMILVTELENVFDVMLDTDDVIDMSSVGKAKEILAKYQIVFE